MLSKAELFFERHDGVIVSQEPENLAGKTKPAVPLAQDGSFRFLVSRHRLSVAEFSHGA